MNILMIFPFTLVLGLVWDAMLKGSHIVLIESEGRWGFYSYLKYYFGVGLFAEFIFLPYIYFTSLLFKYLHPIIFGYTLSVILGITLGVIFQIVFGTTIGTLYTKFESYREKHQKQGEKPLEN